MTDSPADRFAQARKRAERAADPERPRPVSESDELGGSDSRVRDWTRNVRETLDEHPGLWLAAGAAAVVAFGALLYAGSVRRRRRGQREALVGLATRLFAPGYVTEHPEPRPSVLKESFKEASSALAAAAGRELGRRALQAINAKVAEPEWPE